VSANPLVADAVDTSTAFGGAGLLESVSDLSSSLRSGNWLASGLSGVGVALDTAATVADPLGSLIAAGLGWLMEHLEPLKGWLNDLTGDAGAVLGHAATWESVAGAMTGAGDELDRVVRADLEAMSGAAITAYAAYANGLADRVRAAGDSASAMGSALRTCSTVVQVVHDLVRDTLAQLVGSIISWAAEVVFTLGLATPVVVTQVATRVSSLATRIGRSVIDVLTSAKSLKNLLEAMRDALARLASGVRGRLPGSGAAGSGAAEVAGDAARRSGADLAGDAGRAGTRAAEDAARAALPDISDLPHPRDGADLDTWAEAVAARHPTLEPDEIKGIYRYTTVEGCAEMNGYLRGTSQFSPGDAARIQRDVDNAVSGMNKLPRVEGTHYRGTNLPDDVLDQWRVPGSPIRRSRARRRLHVSPKSFGSATRRSVHQAMPSSPSRDVPVSTCARCRTTSPRTRSSYRRVRSTR
jgi:hypothetical protein